MAKWNKIIALKGGLNDEFMTPEYIRALIVEQVIAKRYNEERDAAEANVPTKTPSLYHN